MKDGDTIMKRITRLEASEESLSFHRIRVAAYCRVSTASDEQEESLVAQRQHYGRVINANNEWEFAGIYYDEGISGTKTKGRDSLMSLMEDCRLGKVDRILTKSISRFARNTVDCLEMVRKLYSYGVTILFEKEGVDTATMDSEFFLSILSSLAQEESFSISGNSKWSIQKRFQNGTYIVSTPPYGYENKDGRMVVRQDEAEIVRLVFSRYLEGHGSESIAKELNAKGHFTRRSTRWGGSSILNMLSNEKYKGDALFQKTFTDSEYRRSVNRGEEDQYLVEGWNEAIVSREDFDKVQKLMKTNARLKSSVRGRAKYTRNYVFSHKLICHCCSRPLCHAFRGSPTNKYEAWVCKNHIDDKSSCSMKEIRDGAVKAAFVTMMNKLNFGFNSILKPLASHMDASSKTFQEDDESLEPSEERKALTLLFSQGLIDSAFFSSEMKKLKKNAGQGIGKNGIEEPENPLAELEKLTAFVSSSGVLDAFDEDLFSFFVDHVNAYDRHHIGFVLKCGLELKEVI